MEVGRIPSWRKREKAKRSVTQLERQTSLDLRPLVFLLSVREGLHNQPAYLGELLAMSDDALNKENEDVDPTFDLDESMEVRYQSFGRIIF